MTDDAKPDVLHELDALLVEYADAVECRQRAELRVVQARAELNRFAASRLDPTSAVGRVFKGKP